jgi:hypothetical protein
MIFNSRLDEFIVVRRRRIVTAGLLLPRDEFIISVIYVFSVERFRFYGRKI